MCGCWQAWPALFWVPACDCNGHCSIVTASVCSLEFKPCGWFSCERYEARSVLVLPGMASCACRAPAAAIVSAASVSLVDQNGALRGVLTALHAAQRSMRLQAGIARLVLMQQHLRAGGCWPAPACSCQGWTLRCSTALTQPPPCTGSRPHQHARGQKGAGHQRHVERPPGHGALRRGGGAPARRPADQPVDGALCVRVQGSGGRVNPGHPPHLSALRRGGLPPAGRPADQPVDGARSLDAQRSQHCQTGSVRGVVRSSCASPGAKKARGSSCSQPVCLMNLPGPDW